MCQFTSLLTEHFDQSLDYFFGTSAGILSSFQASFYKEMDVWCDNRCKLDISHWGEDGETLIYIFHPDLNGNDIIALSYFAVNLFVILVSYISIYIKVLCSRHPQHHGAADLRERKLTITLFLVTLGSLLTILPTIICTTVFVFHIQLLLALSRGTFSTFLRQLICYSSSMNSLINPIIYAIQMLELREGF